MSASSKDTLPLPTASGESPELFADEKHDPESAEREAQKEKVLNACRSKDVASLIALSTSRWGFVDDDARRLAWPQLLGLSLSRDAQPDSVEALPQHRDEDQVKLDVNRSFVYYPRESDRSLDGRKEELDSLITEILRRHPSLCYFQGFHDIAQVLLLVLGRREATSAVTRLSLLRIRDFMLPSMTASTMQLLLLPYILRVADASLERHLSACQPFFALSATLTLYAHDIQEYSDIARLYDFLLARESVVSLYLFAVIVLSRKDELLEIEPDEPEMLHSILSKLPQPLDLDGLIATTTKLYNEFPPHKLPGPVWRKISSNSVLKTTLDPMRLPGQTLEDGQHFFDKQAAELRRLERLRQIERRLRQYKKPATVLATAMSVALLAYWLRNNTNAVDVLRYLSPALASHLKGWIDWR